MVCERWEAFSSIYSHGNIGSREYSTGSRMQQSWRRHQEMPRGRRQLAPLGGAPAPRCGLPTTVFCMAICSWARVASMSVLGPDSQGRWASLFVSLLRFVEKRIFVTFSTVFVYMSYKIIIFPYKWKWVKVITYMCKSCLVSCSFGS